MNILQKINPSDITNHLSKYKQILDIQISSGIEKTFLSNVYIYEKFLDPNICDFIIYESEKYSNNYGWETTRHNNYPTTDIPLINIKNIYNIIYNYTIFNIFPLIEKSYKLNMYYLSITDLFIVKYEFDKQNELLPHCDNSIISFNILLNNENDFEGGGTIIHFENHEKLYSIKKGDIILHSGKIKHSGNKITNGKRYIIVGFIHYLYDYNKKEKNNL